MSLGQGTYLKVRNQSSKIEPGAAPQKGPTGRNGMCIVEPVVESTANKARETTTSWNDYTALFATKASEHDAPKGSHDLSASAILSGKLSDRPLEHEFGSED